jgi:hypothetical protein
MEDIRSLREKIALLRKTAEELDEAGESFPALQRNARRILASVRMLEINLPEEV